MPDEIRISPQTLEILGALIASPDSWRYGYDLTRDTGLKSGTLYPILIRLTERGWLETRWEHADQTGKPRHIYRLTAEGEHAARKTLDKHKAKLAALKVAYHQA
jgi:PadR family transcriptional regulator, regulatory protein PadR